jgi:hypothetical protein
MLSVLIPTSNYNISSLVHEIHKQATKANIKFEVICFDDASEKYTYENKLAIDSLPNTRIIRSEKNFGRIQSRQILSNESSYNWLLFLDADVIPKYDKFIECYINTINLGYDVIYGGFAYSSIKPDNDSILRWKYGKTFEEINAKKRNLKPYQIIISANFFIKKPIFNKINSKISRKSYGLDNYFGALLKQNGINVLHLNNEVYHFGIEKNIVYLKKTEECIITLLWLYNSKKMLEHNKKLLSVFVKVKRLKLNYLMSFFYLIFNSKIKKNLVGSNPNMFLLQLYKILFMCYKDLRK